MTRLSKASYEQIQDLLKRLGNAGLTAEHVEDLLMDDSRLREWVLFLDQDIEPEPPTVRIPLEELLPEKGRPMPMLRRMRLAYLDELAECTEEDLLDQRNCGEGTVRLLKNVLRKHGLQLKAARDGHSALVFGQNGGFYRPRVGSVSVEALVNLDYRHDYREGLRPNLTLQQFRNMDLAERGAYYEPSGLRKIDDFIRQNGL